MPARQKKIKFVYTGPIEFYADDYKEAEGIVLEGLVQDEIEMNEDEIKSVIGDRDDKEFREAI